jgi:hypothetical protein
MKKSAKINQKGTTLLNVVGACDLPCISGSVCPNRPGPELCPPPHCRTRALSLCPPTTKIGEMKFDCVIERKWLKIYRKIKLELGFCKNI